MKAFFTITLAFLLALMALFYLYTPKKEPLSQIMVSVAPLKCFAERIVQGKISVSALVHAGQNHETYEISPQEMILLMQAKLYFSTDFPFEKRWIEKVQHLSRKITLVDLQKELFPGEEGRDLHIWTSPSLAKKIARVMVENIGKIDPANERLYRSGYESLIRDLEILDREIASRLAPLRGEKFYVVHPAWDYFAKDYGIEEVALEREGKEPSLQDLASIIESAKKEHIQVIFIQKGVSRKSADAVALAFQGRVEEIDPLEEDYFSNMRKVATKIQRAMSNASTGH